MNTLPPRATVLQIGQIYEIVERGKVAGYFRADRHNAKTGTYTGPMMKRDTLGFVQAEGFTRLDPKRVFIRKVY